ncbi:hypothetical protein N7499_004728 [Penicillium canescens]|nr:hypothetical protein N7499_004728 [Penicillium canescens]KAJ6161883.1 hypothetical protein N7485_010113 [Penicillium canescens]
MIEDREDEDAAELYHTIFEARMKFFDALFPHSDIDVGLGNLNQETHMHLIPFGEDESMTVFFQG